MKMKSITPDTMSAAINSQNVVMLDVYANWCQPCQRMMPLLEEISNEYSEEAGLVKMELDENKEFLQNTLNVQKVPTFIIYKNGLEQKRFEGITRMQVLRDTLDEVIHDTTNN